MKNKDIAEDFVAGKDKGAVKHLYIEGNVLYSYGNHFPMAIRVIDSDGNFKFILNSDKYSVTTSRHQGMLMRAIGNEADVIKRCNTQEMQQLKQFTSVKELMAEKLE